MRKLQNISNMPSCAALVDADAAACTLLINNSSSCLAPHRCAATCCRLRRQSRRAASCAGSQGFDPQPSLSCPTAPPPFKVLYFAVVGERAAGLVDHAAQLLLSLNVSLYLVHHDGSGVVRYSYRDAGKHASTNRPGGGVYTFLPWFKRRGHRRPRRAPTAHPREMEIEKSLRAYNCHHAGTRR